MTTVLHHAYKPRGACREVFSRREDEVLVSGPAGTGKSRACLEKLHMMALVNPGMRGLIVRKTLVSLGSTALDTWRKFVVKEALITGDVRFYGGSTEEPAQYTYSNGSVVVIGGLDNPTKIMSSEYDVIYVQEATELTAKDWDHLTTRLRNWRVSFQQLLADCNPDAETHWLYRRTQRGDTVMLESRHTDNPRLYDDAGKLTRAGAEYMKKLQRLTGVRKKRLCDGLWVSAEGVIYENYDPAIHLIDRFEIPWEWARYWVVDFGFTNPFVCQWWAVDPDNRAYMYREIYCTKRTVDIHARHMLDLVSDLDPDYQHPPGEDRHAHHGRLPWREPQPHKILCDHDAGARAILERELGMSTEAATKNVQLGIQGVEMRLAPREDGKPGMFLLRDSLVARDPDLVDAMLPTCTPEEIPSYVWDTSAGKALKEEPLKKNDHGCDCKRYFVAEIDNIGEPKVRWM